MKKLKKYPVGGTVSAAEAKKRREALFEPIADKLVIPSMNNLPLTAQEVISIYATYPQFNGVSDSKTKFNNPPPMDATLQELQNQINGMPQEKINSLMNYKWKKAGVFDALKELKSVGIGLGDAMKYISHFKKLKSEGYTFENGGETDYGPELSTGLLGMLSFLSMPQEHKQSLINSHLSDNMFNPIATPLGPQTGPIGHFAEGGLIPEEILSAPNIAPESMFEGNTQPSTPATSAPINSDKLFKTYMAHQQGTAGASAIFKAAETGTSWKKYYKGEDLDKNMAGNVGKDFYQNYTQLTPTTFLNYWENKFNRFMRKAATKPSKLDNVYAQVGQQTGVNPVFLKATAMIESSQNPNSNYNKSTQYKGLYQLNQKEFNQNGGGNIYDPLDNTYAAARNFKNLKVKFKEGGEYQMSDEDIENLKAQGYEFDVIN